MCIRASLSQCAARLHRHSAHYPVCCARSFPTLGPSVVEDVRQSKSDGTRGGPKSTRGRTWMEHAGGASPREAEHGWNTRGAQVHERQNMDGTRGGRKSDLSPPRVPSDVFEAKFQEFNGKLLRRRLCMNLFRVLGPPCFL